MTTSRPLVEGDVVVGIADSPIPIIGDAYYWQRSFDPNHYVLSSDFSLPCRYKNPDWAEIQGQRVFGISRCSTSNDPRLLSAIRRGTAPALYVREGDTLEPWTSYQAVLHERRMRALTERHRGLIAQLRLHGAGNIQLRVEDDVVVIRCSGWPSVLEGFAAEGVRMEITDAARSPVTIVDLDWQLAERLAAAPPPPPPPPSPTRFNLLECDLPAVAPPPAKQKNFDALAELQAEFRAAKVTAKTTVQPALTRFDLLECDEPVEPVAVKPKWSAPQSPKQQPAPQQRRTVEDILDLTTSGPLEALAALQIAKAEILRELRQKETN